MGVVDGKAAVVTGAGRGIGAGHAKWLAKEGASVVVNDIDLEEAQKTVDIINKEIGTAVVNNDPIDTTEGAKKIVDQCVSEFGKIDAMVANAGILRDRTFLNMTEQEMRDIFDVHILGTFHTCQAAARQMREQGHGGVLITTTSGAHHGNFGQANYSGAKGWIASMTYTMAMELARYGIRAIAVSPSGSTRMSATALGPGGVPSPGGANFTDPELNGMQVAWLCSDEANWITGQVFGTGSDRFFIMQQPMYTYGIVKPGGVQVADLQQHAERFFKGKLENFGLPKQPYAYYDGVKVQPPRKK